jgi:phage baseplate assembly protein W
MTQEFLGVGWKFPVELNDAGEIGFSRYEEDIREAIWIILSTARGERLMRPDFGCGIHQFIFAPNDTRTAGLVRFHVEEALTRWEPRIELREVTVQASPRDPTLLLINIDYQVKANDSHFNLVYPFYLERGEIA